MCYAEKKSHRKKVFSIAWTSRYRHYVAFERATFEHGKPTQLLMLTNKQIADFQKHYQTEAERFHILPPGIYPDENIATRSRTVVKFIVRKWYLRTAKITVASRV
ncbi:hypothetical protein KCP70_10675 [Salmonella enterica subsp. enterica]|nr:hypothetical protein KCP70_10675 [Salmonella enterica subsp. enterica]